MDKLVRELRRRKVLKTERLIAAFLANDRGKFVPKALAADAYLDMPLPIGDGQTISQPTTVAFMMELLDARAGQRILDVGFGSGWTTGILAFLAGATGRVFGMEINAQVYEFGKTNLEKLAYRNLELYNESGWQGLPERAPFDRILVSAATPEIPGELRRQLRPGGRMVIPVGSTYDCEIYLLEKLDENEFRQESYPGFAFVPLIK